MKINTYLKRVEEKHGCIQAIMSAFGFYENIKDETQTQFYIETPNKIFYFYIEALPVLIDFTEKWMDQDKCAFCNIQSSMCVMYDFWIDLKEIADGCNLQCPE